MGDIYISKSKRNQNAMELRANKQESKWKLKIEKCKTKAKYKI